MRTTFHPAYIVPLLVGLLSACASSQTSLLIADSYDAEKNQTVLMVMPYGNIELPGKWTKTSYNEVSRQHFFTDGDSTTVAVAKQPREKYPFYSSAQNDAEFVRAFHTWDADHWSAQGMTTTLLEDRAADGYIVWQVTGEGVNTIFLFGSKSAYAYNFSVSSTKWSDAEAQRFLAELYGSN